MTKMYDINKRLIVDSWRLVANNDGAAGIDKLTIAEIQKDYKGYLYTLWNRMSSGSYMASPVRKVTIPKADGKERILGIPTVLDRVAQMAAVKTVSERIDGKFHEDSYGYRPKKSAHQAMICQHYYGQFFKRIFVLSHSLLVIDNRLQNGF